MSVSKVSGMTTDEIESRVRALGKWFHNIDLRGVKTAPNHFLGDYPSTKWRGFRDAIPTDLTGRSVLDIGCNGGFYSIEMKQRGARRVVAIDTDEDYLSQARFAADVNRGGNRVPQTECLRSAAASGEVRSRYLHGRALSPASSVARAGSVARSRDEGLAGVSVDAARKQEGLFRSTTIIRSRRPASSKNLIFRGCILSSITTRETLRTGGFRIVRVSEAMLRSSGFEILDHPEEEVYLCKRRESRSQEASIG